MLFKTKQCTDCIFYREDVDFDSVGDEVYSECLLLKRITPGYSGGFIETRVMLEDEPLSGTLPNCPLKETNVTIELEK